MVNIEKIQIKTENLKNDTENEKSPLKSKINKFYMTSPKKIKENEFKEKETDLLMDFTNDSISEKIIKNDINEDEHTNLIEFTRTMPNIKKVEIVF